MEHPRSYQSYKSYTIPQPVLYGYFEHTDPIEVSSTACNHDGTPSAAWKLTTTAQVYITSRSNDGTLSKIPIEDSSSTGDQIQIYAQGDGRCVTWNRKATEDPAAPISQVAIAMLDDTSTQTIDGFYRSDFSRSIDYAEPPRAAYDTSNHLWVVTQTGHNNNEQQGTVYGTFDGVTFNIIGELDAIDGKPVAVRQLILHESDIYALVTNGQKYDAKIAKLELRKWNKTTLEFDKIGDSFDGRTSWAQLMVDRQNIPRLYYVGEDDKFRLRDFLSISEEVFHRTDRNFIKNLCDINFKFESLDYASDTSNRNYCVASYQGVDHSNYKLTINLSTGTHRQKKHTNIKTDNYTTHARFLTSTNDPALQKETLEKKLQQLTFTQLDEYFVRENRRRKELLAQHNKYIFNLRLLKSGFNSTLHQSIHNQEEAKAHEAVLIHCDRLFWDYR